MILIYNSRLNSFSKTVNSGMKMSNTNNDILLLNNDMIALTSFEPFTNFMKTNYRTGIVGAKLLYPNGTIQSVGQVRMRLIIYLETYMNTGNIIIPQQIFQKNTFQLSELANI